MKTTKTPIRYASVLLDYWFKRTFGMEGRQRLLMLFLQEVIPEHKIASLTYAPQEHENPHPDRKGIRVDVECTDEDGTRFVVEMQLARQKHFYERALFNSTFAIQEQMEVGRDTYDFPAVYFIGLMDFTTFSWSFLTAVPSLQNRPSWRSSAMRFTILRLCLESLMDLRENCSVSCLKPRKSLPLPRRKRLNSRTI